MTAETKVCFECKETKPAAEFYTNIKHKDGLSSRCRACTLADMHRRWRAKHPEPELWVMPTEKPCSRCKRVQPMDQFIRIQNPAKASRDGYSSDCKTCRSALANEWNKAHRKRHNKSSKAHYHRLSGQQREDKKDYELLRRLGVPYGTYARLFAEQGGECAICGTTDPGTRLHRFHLDHRHGSNVWRGLLCEKCNRGIGSFNDNPDLLRTAANYLESSPSTSV